MIHQLQRDNAKLHAIEMLTGYNEPFCMDCGCIVELKDIDFHHTRPELKTGNPADILRKHGIKAFYEEVLTRQCVCLCKECHKARHHMMRTMAKA